jgi:RimJ/RimL family protein N-acetyltransferase
MQRAISFGNKVYLRPIEPEDIDRGWLDWINDRSQTINLLQSYPVTRASLETYLAGTQPPGSVMFAVCDIATDTYIGNARLSSIDMLNKTGVYGRLIGHPDFRGHGFGTEALILLLRYGFHDLGLNRIWSTMWVENEASDRSNGKVGMTREGIMREAVYKNGRFWDTVVLAMLRADFDSLHGGPDVWKERDVKLRRKMANDVAAATADKRLGG